MKTPTAHIERLTDILSELTRLAPAAELDKYSIDKNGNIEIKLDNLRPSPSLRTTHTIRPMTMFFPADRDYHPLIIKYLKRK